MAEAIVLFASEATPDGNDFSEEMRMRARLITDELRKRPQAHLLFTASAPGYKPPSLFAALLRKHLQESGIGSERMRTFEGAASTATEVDAAERCLQKSGSYNQVYAAASWHHVPRIRLIWLLRHRRKTRPVYLWFTSPQQMWRAGLEPFKVLLVLTPAAWQDRLGGIARKLRLM